MQIYHGKDLRKGRYPAYNQTYLVTVATYERKIIFTDWHTGRLLVKELRAVSEARMVETLAWVIMPDHLHWLFVLKRHDLASVLRNIKSRSAIAINKHTGGAGKIWQKGYHDHAVRRDDDLKTIARYVVANPLRAGITDKLGSYPLWDAVWL